MEKRERSHTVWRNVSWCSLYGEPCGGCSKNKTQNHCRLQQSAPADLLLLFSCQVRSDSFATPWIVARQAPLSKGFSRQEYCSELLFSSPGDCLNPGIKPRSSALQMTFSPLSHLRSLAIELPHDPAVPPLGI